MLPSNLSGWTLESQDHESSSCSLVPAVPCNPRNVNSIYIIEVWSTSSATLWHHNLCSGGLRTRSRSHLYSSQFQSTIICLILSLPLQPFAILSLWHKHLHCFNQCRDSDIVDFNFKLLFRVFWLWLNANESLHLGSCTNLQACIFLAILQFSALNNNLWIYGFMSRINPKTSTTQLTTNIIRILSSIFTDYKSESLVKSHVGLRNRI